MTTMQRWELSAFGRENLSLVSVPPLIDIVAERFDAGVASASGSNAT